MQDDANKPVLWKPKSIEPPEVDRALSKLPPIQRAAEVVRYSVLRIEHWLSPNGRLREWIRLNILAALLIGIPALIIVPILTYLLGQFVTWMMFLAAAAKNLVVFVGYMLLATAMISAAVMILRSRRNH
jgi:hypothetical protein